MNTLKKLYVHEVDGSIYIMDQRLKYVNTGKTIQVHGISLGVSTKVSKIIDLKDFYRMHGKSSEYLQMLYPEVNWKKYQKYFKEFDYD